MQVQQTTAKLRLSSGPEGLFRRLVRVAVRVRKMITGRVALRQLEEMEDWQLTDIGVSRRDVHFVGDRSWLDDPTHLLDQIARERAKEIVRKRP